MDEKNLNIDKIKKILDNAKQYLVDLKVKWDNEIDFCKKNWFFINHDKLVVGTKFIISSLDELIHYVENTMPSYEGKDKKAVVIMIIDELFDYIISPTLPLWLNPFVPKFKKIVFCNNEVNNTSNPCFYYNFFKFRDKRI